MLLTSLSFDLIFILFTLITLFFFFFFFFNDTATTEIYTLSLHDALPDLLAGLHVEREHVRVDRLAEELALVDRRRAPHERAAGRDAQRSALVLDGRAPDLPAGRDVDGEGPVAVDHVHDAVVDRRLRVLAHVVRQTEAPDRDQAPDVGLVDFLERAVHLQVVAHAEGGDVLGVLPVVEQLFGRLGPSEPAPGTQQCRQHFLHDVLLPARYCMLRARRRETRRRDARPGGQPLLCGHASQHRRFVGRPGQIFSLGHGGADPGADRARLDGGGLAGVADEARAFLLAQVDRCADPRAG